MVIEMKRILSLLVALNVFAFPVLTQERVKEIVTDGDCSYYGETLEKKIYTFDSDKEAEAAVDKILYQTGLARNFTIRASDVPNAAAIIQGETRYVLYSQEFIRRVKQTVRTDWAALSIMAHEIGHHLQGHTLQRGGSRPPIELEADTFSGFVMYKMGANLEQAQAAMRAFAGDVGTATHPGKKSRLAAIEAGWTHAKDISEGGSNKPRMIELDAKDFKRQGDVWVDNNPASCQKGLLYNAPPFVPRPNWVEFEFEAVEAVYNFEIEYAAKEARKVVVILNGEIVSPSALDDTTGGWCANQTKWESLPKVRVRTGKNVIRITRNNVFPHIKTIRLTPVIDSR
jgi:hypothetical protein